MREPISEFVYINRKLINSLITKTLGKASIFHIACFLIHFNFQFHSTSPQVGLPTKPVITSGLFFVERDHVSWTVIKIDHSLVVCSNTNNQRSFTQCPFTITSMKNPPHISKNMSSSLFDYCAATSKNQVSSWCQHADCWVLLYVIRTMVRLGKPFPWLKKWQWCLQITYWKYCCSVSRPPSVSWLIQVPMWHGLLCSLILLNNNTYPLFYVSKLFN